LRAIENSASVPLPTGTGQLFLLDSFLSFTGMGALGARIGKGLVLLVFCAPLKTVLQCRFQWAPANYFF
jgi:hypothetical protein